MKMTARSDYENYYSIERLEGEMSSSSQQERLDAIADYCEGSVLDIGAGVGMLERKLAKKGFKNVVAIDIKPDYVGYMQQQGFDAMLGDARHLPNIQDESYDTVVLAEILEHLLDPSSALKEAVRIAKKKVVLTLPVGNQKDEWHHWDIHGKIVGGCLLVLEMKKVK